MPRVSGKENKNPFFRKREELGLTREEAAELLEAITPERIEKIENERSDPHPDEILLMADRYKAPELCNYYCATQCPIGKKYVPEIKLHDLSRIVLEMLASLNTVNRNRDRLIDIAADGKIETEELDDFIQIRRELDRISETADALRLWSEQMLADGSIDREEYERRMKKTESTDKNS